MSSEWYLDIFIFTYFDVYDGLFDQNVFKKTIINQKHDYHGQFLFEICIRSIYYVVAWSRCLVWVYLQNTITLGVEFEHCDNYTYRAHVHVAKSIQIDQI